MKLRQSAILFALLACAVSPGVARADLIYVDAVQRGWIKQNGAENGTAADNGYAAGNCGVSMTTGCRDGEVRNFFVFNVPAFSGQVVTAGLVVDTGAVTASQSTPMTYQLTSLSTPFEFSALGTGTLFGSRKYAVADAATTIEIPLNAAAAAAIRPMSQFGLGGRIAVPLPQGTAGKPEFVFAGAPGRTRLHVVTMATIVDVVEFYNASLDHYFISSLQPDIDALDAGHFPGWARTGETFRALSEPSTVTSPVCRFYIPPPYGDSHFYSASPAECDVVKSTYPMFVYESAAVMNVEMPDPDRGRCPSGRVPVYRLWNARADTNHRYTTSTAIRDAMLAKGYVPEGYGPDAVAMCGY